MLQAVTSLLSNPANVQPMLVVLEELHDADKGTLDRLAHVSRNLAGARLLIVGTYRDVEVDRSHPLSAALAELRRVSTYGRVLLRGLNADEVRRMLESITRESVPWGLAEAVHRQTEGNPLFVQEVVRYLVEEGLTTRKEGGWRSTKDTPLEMSIPEGLRDVIGKRLSLLTLECNQLLAVASEKYFLRVNGEYELCIICHAEKKVTDRKRQMPVNGEVISQRPPGVLVSHKPFLENKCKGCHEITPQHREKPDAIFLCFREGCHKPELLEKPYLHNKSVVRNCYACHESHASGYGKLLRANEEQQCGTCHPLFKDKNVQSLPQYDKEQSNRVHRAFAAYLKTSAVPDGNECGFCHNKNHWAQIGKISPTACSSCHLYIKNMLQKNTPRSKNVHEAFKDEERTVGASLGEQNVERGLNAAILGFVLIVIFMMTYYKVFGVLANLALALNAVLLVAVLSVVGVTLTVPGIAAIVLTLGMAVDANVIIFARIKEELATRAPQAASHAGFDRAFLTILDSNLTTLFIGIILLAIASGPVKGFAVVLSIGILTSMFTAVTVTRAFINLTYGGRQVQKLYI